MNIPDEEFVMSITKAFFDMPPPSIYLTYGGSAAAVFTKVGGGMKPWIGAYYTGESWLPCSWSDDGRFLDSDTTTKLDLMLESNKESA